MCSSPTSPQDLQWRTMMRGCTSRETKRDTPRRTGVRVRESHRIVERRSKVGTVFGRYGGEGYVAVEVRFPEGAERLFWPRDLEKVSAPRAWWHFLLGGDAAEVNLKR